VTARPALLVTDPVWVQVVAAAGRQCECERARCHGKAPRCEHESTGGRPLLAAPRDPSTPVESAWRLQVADLAAWCSPCLSAARAAAVRKAAATKAPEPTAELPLFGGAS
jgi:hypothetical protein